MAMTIRVLEIDSDFDAKSEPRNESVPALEAFERVWGAWVRSSFGRAKPTSRKFLTIIGRGASA